MKPHTLLPILLSFVVPCACCLAAESGDNDREAPLVKKGVLGTVNVLRELDPRTFTNLVKVVSNVPGRDSTPEDTMDASGKPFRPNLGRMDPLVLTYTLPAVRTISALTIAYEYASNDSPEKVLLETSADGGKTWVKAFESNARNNDFVKVFALVQANVLRLTQTGDGTDKSLRRTKEVCAYADSDAPAPAGGAFNFARSAWYAGEITQFRSPDTAAWTRPFGGKSFPHAPFGSTIADGHDGAWGGSDKNEAGRRVFLRMDLATARRMDFGVIGSVPSGEGNKLVLAATSRAEFYTANGAIDPGTLSGAAAKDITAQGWILQKAWENDANPEKNFCFAQPGKYNQVLIVWDALGLHPMPQNWGRLELFSAEGAAAKSEK